MYRVIEKKVKLKNNSFDETLSQKAYLMKSSGALGAVTSGKRVEHRVVRLYTPATLNNAPFDFIFGVDKL